MRVLVPIDEDSFAQAQTDFIVSFKWPQSTTFFLLHIMHSQQMKTSHLKAKSPMDEMRKESIASYEVLVSKITERLDKELPDAMIISEVRRGKPAESILEVANSWPSDLILLASHGRGGVSRSILGSVSDSVMTRSPCQVIVIGMPKLRPAEYIASPTPLRV
ncbi:MAG: universal stress protein [Cyanobacteria bacterium]|nr:universal stress protein [Cyanobacteriota bacterium]